MSREKYTLKTWPAFINNEKKNSIKSFNDVDFWHKYQHFQSVMYCWPGYVTILSIFMNLCNVIEIAFFMLEFLEKYAIFFKQIKTLCFWTWIIFWSTLLRADWVNWWIIAEIKMIWNIFMSISFLSILFWKIM